MTHATVSVKDLEQSIRNVPDFPKPGIQFKDITPLLADPKLLSGAIDLMTAGFKPGDVDAVVGIDARGFIFAAAAAVKLKAGFIPVRKKGKLPHETVRLAYSLEYGVDEMEVHRDAVRPGERVILVDDLIATGGTATAAIGLLRQIGAEVVAACFVIDLPELGGAAKIAALGVPVRTLVAFDGH